MLGKMVFSIFCFSLRYRYYFYNGREDLWLKNQTTAKELLFGVTIFRVVEHLLIYSFSQYFLSTYYVPGTMLDSGNITAHLNSCGPCPHRT